MGTWATGEEGRNKKKKKKRNLITIEKEIINLVEGNNMLLSAWPLV